MQQLQPLNSREKKEIYEMLEQQFGHTRKMDVIFLENQDGRLFILSNDYAKIDSTNLRVNNKGLYFGKKERDGLRLSIEGSQLVAPTKNIIHVTREQADAWMKGDDIPLEGDAGYVLLQLNKDILGCGMHKNNILRNMVPKERRLKSITY